MSMSYEILIKNKEPIELVVSGLEAILGCTLKHSIGRRREYHSAVVLGLGISLVNPVPYDDDDEIKFSGYDFEIMIEYKGEFDSVYSNDFRRIATIVLANMVSQNLHCECLALENLTRVLEEFVPSDA